MSTKLNKVYIAVFTIIALLLLLLILMACSKEDNISKGLTYTVDNELSFNANYNLNNFDDADKLESKITNHVDNAVNDMNNIFNKRKVSILDYGAKPCEIIKNEPGKFKASDADQTIMDEYAKNNTKAIYKAICEVSKQGGGTIVIPAANGNVFYTCALHLEDNINLFIEEGATLKFTTNTNLYCGDFMKEVYGDGVDPESTSNMVIRNNVFDVGDDCIAVKSGRNTDGLRINKPTYNLVIHDNLMEDGAGDGGIAIGSEITGGVKNVFSHNNTMLSDNILNPYKFKTNYIRGGFIENVFLRDDDVKVVNSKNCAISVDLNYDVKQEVEKMKATGAKFNAYMPSFKNVHIKNFNANQDKIPGKGGKFTFQFRGFLKESVSDDCENKNDASDCYVSDITIEDSSFYGSNQAFDLQYVDGLVLQNVSINGTLIDDKFVGCKNLIFENCNFTNSKINSNKLKATENSNILNCDFD